MQLLDLRGIRTLVALGWVAAGFLFDLGVSFDWVETLPSRGMCSSAKFVGSFSCTVQNSLPTRIEGTIVLELAGPSEMQQLDVASGTIAFRDLDLTDTHTVAKVVKSTTWSGGTLTAPNGEASAAQLRK